MTELVSLIKSSFSLIIQTMWLKYIDRETNKYFKYQAKLSKQQSRVNFLLREYKEIYHEDLRKVKSDEQGA